MDPIAPKDAALLQDLQKQLEIGKAGFSLYYQGNLEEGAREIKQALKDSVLDIQAIDNFRLHRQAKNLLNQMNAAIRDYMKQPSDEKLDALKSKLETYEQFLNQK
jgi:hypothetical protein